MDDRAAGNGAAGERRERINLKEVKPPSDELALIEDDVEAGRVVKELHYVLTAVDVYSPFIDKLVEAALEYGGETYRQNIELLDGRGSYSAEEIVSGVVLAAAAAEKLVSEAEEKFIARGIIHPPSLGYLEELRERFGKSEKMRRITSRLNIIGKEGIKIFLDEVRGSSNPPSKAMYRILKRQKIVESTNFVDTLWK